jgi:hypothetical protein
MKSPSMKSNAWGFKTKPDIADLIK